MEIRPLLHSDSKSIWQINEEGLPGTGKVSEKEIVDLLNYSEISIGIYEEDVLLGFVICLPPSTTYGSLNYAGSIVDTANSCMSIGLQYLFLTEIKTSAQFYIEK